METSAKRNGNVVELDVRKIQEAKEEPFEIIMDTVKSLKEDDTFILHAIINPMPLLRVMEGKGFTSEAEQIEEKHWKITFSRGV